MKKQLLAFLTAASLCLAPVTACFVVPQGVIVSQAASLKLKTVTLQIHIGEDGTVKLKNKAGEKVTWSVPDEYSGIIRIKKSNKKKAVITGLTPGTAKVTAQVKGGVFICDVTVTGSSSGDSSESGEADDPTSSYTGITTAPAGATLVTSYDALPDDGEDDTEGFNQAIWDAAARSGVVYVPAGQYQISINGGVGIGMQSGVHLMMHDKAVLNVTGTDQDWYNVIYIANAENVSITGGRISGERSVHKGSDGEDGMGIGILDSTNVTITGMTISDNWGDGIYLGTTSALQGGCKNVTIDSCKISRNRRNNISIIHASDVTIKNCSISDAYGKQPQGGIIIEPNLENGKLPVCKNITIQNTTISCKQEATLDGNFYCFMTIHYPGDSSVKTCDNVTITGCKFNGSCFNGSGVNMSIKNSKISGIFYDARNARISGDTTIGKYEKVE